MQAATQIAAAVKKLVAAFRKHGTVWNQGKVAAFDFKSFSQCYHIDDGVDALEYVYDGFNDISDTPALRSVVAVLVSEAAERAHNSSEIFVSGDEGNGDAVERLCFAIGDVISAAAAKVQESA